MIRDPQLRISKLGREVYICLKDVITKKGEEAAMAIYKEKDHSAWFLRAV